MVSSAFQFASFLSLSLIFIDGVSFSTFDVRSADDASLEPVPGESLLFFLLALALFYYVFRVARQTFAGRQSVARAVKAATEGDDSLNVDS